MTKEFGRGPDDKPAFSEGETEKELFAVEKATEVTPELVDAAKNLVTDLASTNQVEITPEWMKKIVDSEASSLLVARDDKEKIVGMGILVVYPTLVNPRALLETLGVDPAARRKGVGTALIKEALEEARIQKVNTVRAFTGKENEAGNRLFENAGGVRTEELNEYEFVLSVGPQK